MSNSYRITSKAGADFGVYQGTTAEFNRMDAPTRSVVIEALAVASGQKKLEVA